MPRERSSQRSRRSSTSPRAALAEHVDRFRLRRLQAEPATIEIDGVRTQVLVDAAESPLAWLRRRRGADGRPLIDDAAFAAGERLRADIARAGLLPRMTVDWTRPPSGGGSLGPAAVADAALDARARVEAASHAVGKDLAGLLIDVCGFLKGLEAVEQERRWPARSAKVVLSIALARLAEHYGYATVARGPASSRLRRWRTPDARPALG